jgi:hypothetical protein
MPLLLLGALGLFGLLALSSKKPPLLPPAAPQVPPMGKTYDMGMDQPTTTAVSTLLTSETDPVTLTQASNLLAAAGFTNAAMSVAQRAFEHGSGTVMQRTNIVLQAPISNAPPAVQPYAVAQNIMLRAPISQMKAS